MSVFRISTLNIIRNGRLQTALANFSDDASKKGKKGDDSSDDEPSAGKKVKQIKPTESKKEVKSKRLDDLLASMSTDLDIVKEVIKPKSAAEKRKRQKVISADTKDSQSANVAEAAKKVAETLGGDSKKTESELLSRLLKVETKVGDLNSLIGGMQVEKNASPPFARRSDFVRKSVAQRPAYESNERTQMHDGFQRPKRVPRELQSSVRMSVDLFGGQPLGIFTQAGDLQDSAEILPTWNHLHNRELKLAVTHPPRNYFEKMAVWTDQGKLWKFPIDNEQGMDEEAKNYFTEHIFLDRHLESWCPTKGPVRHFMELVCVGLSKNPYYTVTQKREHIEWYRDYFAGKKELLESVIVDAGTPKELQQ